MCFNLTRFCTGLQPSDLHGDCLCTARLVYPNLQTRRSVGTVELLCVTPLWCALSVPRNMAGTPVGCLSTILLYVCAAHGWLGGGCEICGYLFAVLVAFQRHSLLAAVCLPVYLLAPQVGHCAGCAHSSDTQIYITIGHALSIHAERALGTNRVQACAPQFPGQLVAVLPDFGGLVGTPISAASRVHVDVTLLAQQQQLHVQHSVLWQSQLQHVPETAADAAALISTITDVLYMCELGIATHVHLRHPAVFCALPQGVHVTLWHPWLTHSSPVSTTVPAPQSGQMAVVLQGLRCLDCCAQIVCCRLWLPRSVSGLFMHDLSSFAGRMRRIAVLRPRSFLPACEPPAACMRPQAGRCIPFLQLSWGVMLAGHCAWPANAGCAV